MKKTKKLTNPNINYPVGDFLIRVKNAKMAKIREITVPNTKFIKEVAIALKKEGFLEEVKTEDQELIVRLTFRKKEPIITDLILVSKPGLRIYMGVEEVEKQRGPEVLIISTPLGILSGKEVIKKRQGGEVIAKIW